MLYYFPYVNGIDVTEFWIDPCICQFSHEIHDIFETVN